MWTTAVVVTLSAAVAAGCGSGDTNVETAGRTTGSAGVEVRIPPGWRAIRGPLNEVTEPAQVLAVASVPINLGPDPAHNCRPGDLLARLPADQAAVQIVDYAQGPGDAGHPNRGDFPPRPRSFRLDRRLYAEYECSGPSYIIRFRDQGRALQATVWLGPKRVDPEVRRQVIALLDSLRVSR
jgi:hypothetical protein